MCVQIQEVTLTRELQKAEVPVEGKTTSELNKEFLSVKKGEKLPGAPATFDEIPAGKIVVADMSNYKNIHIVARPEDLSHLKNFQADYYLVDKLAIQGLY